MLLHIAQVHVRHAVQQLYKLFIALCDSSPQFVAVHVEIIEQPLKVPFRGAAFSGVLDMMKYCFQRFV